MPPPTSVCGWRPQDLRPSSSPAGIGEERAKARSLLNLATWRRDRCCWRDFRFLMPSRFAYWPGVGGSRPAAFRRKRRFLSGAVVRCFARERPGLVDCCRKWGRRFLVNFRRIIRGASTTAICTLSPEPANNRSSQLKPFVDRAGDLTRHTLRHW